MRKYLTALLAALLCLLAACVVREDAAPADAAVYVAPDYQFQTMSAREEFFAEDGTQLAHYSYELLTMEVTNLEALSPEVREQAERNLTNFNQRMQELLDASAERGREMGELAKEEYAAGGTAVYYTDETTASGHIGGEIVSVRMDNYSYSGGAHENTVISGYVFDVSGGQFIDPAQVADDPVAFREKAAALLLEEAEAKDEDIRSGYWSDYKDIISRWNEGTVVFDEAGMTVVYSPYELGPYAMGTVNLFLPYDALAEGLGPGGLKRLGV